jgi:hypothetical protein
MVGKVYLVRSTHVEHYRDRTEVGSSNIHEVGPGRARLGIALKRRHLRHHDEKIDNHRNQA